MTDHTLTMDEKDIQLIVRALIKYKPAKDETVLISMVTTQINARNKLITWLEHYLEHMEDI